MKKRIFSVAVILAMLISLFTITAYAGASEKENNGIKVKVETDKDSYSIGDKMKVNITIENTSDKVYRNVAYSLLLSKNMDMLKVEGNYPSGTILTFNSGDVYKQEFNFTVTDGKDENADTTAGDKKKGDNDMVKILVIIAVVAIVIVALVLIVMKGKGKKGTTAAIIVLVGAAAMAMFGAMKVKAVNEKSSVNHVISIDGKEDMLVLSATVKGVNASNIGIHDPSVFQDPVSGKYYSYGSHIVAGSSDDLMNWNYIAVSSSAYASSNKLFAHHYLQEFKEVYTWLGADVKEGIWALDVTYSEKAAAAGNDPYLMYVTVVNGSFKSAICLATSSSPEGPFSYKGMIVCSDFRQAEVKNGHTNLLEVLGYSSVDEMTTTQKSYYFTTDSAAYKAKLPDAIDPAPFYDAEGNLYLTYGSFTCKGGLRVLKLDATTGLRSNETYEYKTDGSQDPYFGKKIANANGEGPYILRVDSEKSSTGSYYFLFWSQGNLRATGGYNMRMFRSEYPDKGYVDYAGNSALANIGGTNLGVRIMDGFLFSTMTYPSTANGGNSAIVTKEGKIFVHYHSKSSNASAYGENGFIIKSNQMFLNEDGWLVTTPFKYSGETLTALDKSAVVGDYEFIYHRLAYYKDPANVTDNYVTSQVITLKEDGSITGLDNASWTLKDNYITVKIGDNTYKGVVLDQCDESSGRKETIVFTASGKDNRTVWGSRIYYTDAEKSAKDAASISISKEATADFALKTEGKFKSQITWTSDNAAIVVDNGVAKVVPQNTETKVTLTAVVTSGTESVTKTYEVTVPAEVFDIPSVVSTSSITLPATTAAGNKITWKSSDSSIINVATGKVNVPASGSKKVTLTGTVEGSDRVISVEVTVMPIPAKEVYSENFDGMASIDASSASGLWYSTNAAAAVTLGNKDGGKFVQFAPGSANSRGAVSSFPLKSTISGLYLVEFDLALTAGNNQTTEFALVSKDMAYLNNVINDGIASGYMFKLSSNNSETWAINDGDTFTLSKGSWVHVSALVNGTAGTVTVTITSGSNTIYEGTVSFTGSDQLKGFYVRGGRYESVTCVDNVSVKQN